MLQESTPAFLAALEATSVLDDLPHRLTVAREDPFAGAVASRWPLRNDDVLYAGERPIALRATIDVAGRPVRLYAVHVVSPFGGSREAWIRETASVGEALAAEKGPVLVAGDFNATWGNRPFRRLLELGLTDAAAARGAPLHMTWPRNLRLVPAMARIDHVLTTDGLTVTRIRSGTGRGSDHRPLLADVALV